MGAAAGGRRYTMAGGTYRGVMRRPLLDLLQRVDPTTVIVVAALIVAPVIGFLIPTRPLGRLAIHGTMIVTSCTAHHPGWSRQVHLSRSVRSGRRRADDRVRHLQVEAQYTEQEMLNASVASLDAREARLDPRGTAHSSS